MTAQDDKAEGSGPGANPGSPQRRAQRFRVPWGSLSHRLRPREVHRPVSHVLGTRTAKVTLENAVSGPLLPGKTKAWFIGAFRDMPWAGEARSWREGGET